MNTKHRINSDIYQTLSVPSLNHFSVIEVRNRIQANSNKYGNNNNARQFVSRQFHLLEKVGLISSKGSGRNKVFSKTAQFHKADFELVDKRSKANKAIQPMKRDPSTVVTLEKEKNGIEAELTVALAEIDEYKVLMSRSTELSQLLKPSYLRATQRSTLLLAKLNVWSDALSVVQNDKVATC